MSFWWHLVPSNSWTFIIPSWHHGGHLSSCERYDIANPGRQSGVSGILGNFVFYGKGVAPLIGSFLSPDCYRLFATGWEKSLQ
jgi:hypothetical protein